MIASVDCARACLANGTAPTPKVTPKTTATTTATQQQLCCKFVGLHVLLRNKGSCCRDLQAASLELRLQLQPCLSMLFKPSAALDALMALCSLETLEVLFSAFVKLLL